MSARRSLVSWGVVCIAKVPASRCLLSSSSTFDGSIRPSGFVQASKTSYPQRSKFRDHGVGMVFADDVPSRLSRLRAAALRRCRSQ